MNITESINDTEAFKLTYNAKYICKYHFLNLLYSKMPNLGQNCKFNYVEVVRTSLNFIPITQLSDSYKLKRIYKVSQLFYLKL